MGADDGDLRLETIIARESTTLAIACRSASERGDTRHASIHRNLCGMLADSMKTAPGVFSGGRFDE
ncbi:hypothetical protein MJO55_07960 [Mycolicibacterium rufum]|uniref:Uncharacterized protein n=1 Tax=Mycolicibacterium rufum TaxID=318424 RepID=A0ABY3UJH2_9MYCO|nr:hypothetical protein [Mycolicibacterium rufum]KGI67408.1 hypothetical protein EU78_08075 [Mycolicibacterium rufum]ULP38346.1 hypothetical protein MJO55_07960 [Mycolicibacterium rufum]